MEITNKQSKKNTQEMPYEKFLRFGEQSLTEAELLAIILRTGTKDISAVELGRQILGMAGSLNGLYNTRLCDLMELKGIGEVKAVKIKCIAELSRRMAKECARETLLFNNPPTVAAYYMEELRHEKREKVMLILLDSKGVVLDELVLSTGTVNASLISTREIFIEVLRAEAVSMVLLHNHPSGDPTPSEQDEAITSLIQRGANILDVVLIDHIIIGDNKYYSFREHEYL